VSNKVLRKILIPHLFKKELVFLRVLLLFDILFFDTLRDVVTDEGEGVRVWE